MRRSSLWARVLLRSLAPRDEVDTVLGDFEERRYTVFETLDMAVALVRGRLSSLIKGSGTLQDYKLGLRMLVKYPGLTIAGGLALAMAIAIGAAWYDFMGDFFRPRLPFPDGDRIVEVEMRNAAAGEDERRIAYDLAGWRGDARSIELLGAYRTLERNLILGNGQPEPIIVAETTASMFQLTRVPPLLGRHLIEADEQPGAEPVVVLGYHVWAHRFASRTDVIGRPIQLGRAKTTIVGVSLSVGRTHDWDGGRRVVDHVRSDADGRLAGVRRARPPGAADRSDQCIEGSVKGAAHACSASACGWMGSVNENVAP